MLCIDLQFKIEDLAQSFTSHYSLTAHPMPHKNNINRKRLKNNTKKNKRSLHKWMRVLNISVAGLWRMLLEEAERNVSML